jgi:hypothetical protein
LPQTSQRPDAEQAKRTWTLSNQGHFSRLHGLFFLENARLHVYGGIETARNPQTGQMEPSHLDDALRLRWRGEPYWHEIYDLVNGKWEKTEQEFSQRPEHYLDFHLCDQRDGIDIENASIKKAFWPWPGTQIKIKDVTKFPPVYATVVYSGIPKEKGVAYRPGDRTLDVALVVHGKGGWRLLDGIDSTGPPVRFCGTKTLSASEDGQEHPVLLLLSVQGDFNVLDSYILD